MKRRSFIAGGSAFITVLASPVVMAAERGYNHYVAAQAEQTSAKTLVASSGDTWRSLFGEQFEVARFYNRQNLQLETGQLVLVPPKGALDVMSQAVMPDFGEVTKKSLFVLVRPRVYAWGIFKDAQLLRWGPAACGGDWCKDVSRACRSPSGTFSISEIAGPDRRSGSYPKELAAEGKGALMPYFLRITSYGVGLHARYIRGRHETHGCVGLFFNDAQWLNEEQASRNQLKVRILPYDI